MIARSQRNAAVALAAAQSAATALEKGLLGMGMEFFAEPGPVVGWVVTCACPEVTQQAQRHASYEIACAALRATPGAQGEQPHLRPALAGCAMPECCPESPLMVLSVEAEPSPVVSVHGASARVLLEALHVPEYEHVEGECAPEEFLQRVLVAQGLALPEFEVPPRAEGPRWFVGGRPAGTLARHLIALEELAHWCRARRREVVWS